MKLTNVPLVTLLLARLPMLTGLKLSSHIKYIAHVKELVFVVKSTCVGEEKTQN